MISVQYTDKIIPEMLASTEDVAEEEHPCAIECVAWRTFMCHRGVSCRARIRSRRNSSFAQVPLPGRGEGERSTAGRSPGENHALDVGIILLHTDVGQACGDENIAHRGGLAETDLQHQEAAGFE